MKSNSNNFELEAGQVAVIPTDTVYGLVAKAEDQVAVGRLYGLKKREAKPGTIIAANIDQLVELGIKRRYLAPVSYLWPNPISVVVPNEISLRYLDMGLGTLAVRIPKDEDINKLLTSVGPLLTTSANLPDKNPAETIDQAIDYFGDKVDVYVDEGVLKGRVPSTIVRVTDDVLDVLREGAIKFNEKGEIMG